MRREYSSRIRRLSKGVDFEIPEDEFVLSELVRMASKELFGRIPEWIKIERVLENLRKDSFKVTFWGDFGVWKSFSRIFVGDLSRKGFSRDVERGRMDFGDFEIEVLEGLSKDVNDFSVDLEKIDGRLLFRNRKRGDKIDGRKLKDVLIDAKVPAYMRDEIPILTAGDEIIWVPGVWYDESCHGYGLRFKVLKSPLEGR